MLCVRVWPGQQMVTVVCSLCTPPAAERHRCCRCGQPFLVYENGRYQDVDECVYHYAKLRKHRGELVCACVPLLASSQSLVRV